MCGNCLSFLQTTRFHFKPSFPIASWWRGGAVYGTGTERSKSLETLGWVLQAYREKVNEEENSNKDSKQKRFFWDISEAVGFWVESLQRLDKNTSATTWAQHSSPEVARARNGALVPTCLGIPEDLYGSGEREALKHGWSSERSLFCDSKHNLHTVKTYFHDLFSDIFSFVNFNIIFWVSAD